VGQIVGIQGVLLCLLLASLSVVTPQVSSQGGQESYTEHAPIRLTGDTSLLLPDIVTGNGVVSGTGGSGDPYVIKGWRIGFDPATGPALSLRGITAHVLIEDLLLEYRGSPDSVDIRGWGFSILDSTNVTLSRVRVVGDYEASRVEGASTVTLKELHFEDSRLHITGSTVEITDHTSVGPNAGLSCFSCALAIDGAEFDGYAYESRGGFSTPIIYAGPLPGVEMEARPIMMEDILVRGAPSTAIRLISTPADLRDIHIDRSGGALDVTGGVVRVEGLRVTNPHAFTAAVGADGANFRLVNAAITSESPLTLIDSEAFIERVFLDESRYGLRVVQRPFAPPFQVTVRESSFTNIRDEALITEGLTIPVDARENWWGSPEGPVVDGQEGPRAGIVGNIVYTPWLTVPPQGAPESRMTTPSIPGFGLAALPGLVLAAMLLRHRPDA